MGQVAGLRGPGGGFVAWWATSRGCPRCGGGFVAWWATSRGCPRCGGEFVAWWTTSRGGGCPGGEFVAWWATSRGSPRGDRWTGDRRTRDPRPAPRLAHGGIIRRVIATLRAMPPGIRIFLGYAFLVLGLIGLSLRWVVDQAISAPISPPGLVVMVLLAYTIFTTTLVLQRKEAARGLALGLSTLTIPAVPLALLAAQPLFALFVGVLAILLFTGLTRPAVRAWLNEP